MECDTADGTEMSHGEDREEEKGNVSDVKTEGRIEQHSPSDSRSLEERGCVRLKTDVWISRNTNGVEIQLLRRSSVAVSTSQDFDDNATITAFWRQKQRLALICSIMQLCDTDR